MNYRCRVCGDLCRGTYMRTHPSHSRAINLLMRKEVPKTIEGGPELCHHCQRGIYFAGGMNEFLVKKFKLLRVALICAQEPVPSKPKFFRQFHRNVHFVKSKNSWQATLNYYGKRVYAGRHKTKASAIRSIRAVAKELAEREREQYVQLNVQNEQQQPERNGKDRNEND